MTHSVEPVSPIRRNRFKSVRRKVLVVALCSIASFFLGAAVQYIRYVGVLHVMYGGNPSPAEVSYLNVGVIRGVTKQFFQNNGRYPSTIAELLEYEPALSKFLFSPLAPDGELEAYSLCPSVPDNLAPPLIYETHPCAYRDRLHMVSFPTGERVFVSSEELGRIIENASIE